MDIAKDREAYILSKLVGEFESEKSGTSFLYQYWLKSGEIKYIQKLLGDNISFNEDETQYVISVENICERLIILLNRFLREPYCVSIDTDVAIDSTVQQYASELIVALESLKDINFSLGWARLVELFSKTVFNIENLTSRLCAINKVCFYTNTRPEDFLSAGQIDFHNKCGKFFIRKY